MPNHIEDFRIEKTPEEIRQELKKKFSEEIAGVTEIASVTAALKLEADQPKIISEIDSNLSSEDNK